MSTISKYICVLLLSSTAIGAKATEGLEADSLRTRESQGIQFADKDKDRLMRLACEQKNTYIRRIKRIGRFGRGFSCSNKRDRQL